MDKNKKPKPYVGQRVFSLNVMRRPKELTPCIVTKVGRKYFNVINEDDESGWSDTRFTIDGWEELRHRLYETEQEWENERDTDLTTYQEEPK